MRIWVAGIGILILVVGGLFFFKSNLSLSQTIPAATPTLTQTVAPPPQSSNQKSQQNRNYYFPLPNYFARITVKHFGQFVSANDHFNVPCGAAFTGYHDGDDLEVVGSELTSDVPVHAIADGTINSVERVSGYGGLLIMNTNINSLPVTVNYGHINLASAKVRPGDKVKAGQALANLGAGCSSQTDGERKHLHFAVHVGSTPDVRGYEPNAQALSSWLNPGETLKGLGAVEP